MINALKLLQEKDQIEIFESVKDMLYNYDIKDVAYIAEVCPSTLYYWLEGKTKFPRLSTIVKVAYALGYELKLVKVSKGRGRPQLKLVK